MRHALVDGLRLNFNSIKVQLELEYLCTTFCFFVFQFHKGTIRTPFLAVFSRFLITFQFHKGTIRTCVLFVSFCLCCHFNSIKVQLEPSRVRIEISFFPAFQFHKGTIRTAACSLAEEGTGVISIP